MKLEQAARLALEALEMHAHGAGSIIHTKLAWDALREALAEPELNLNCKSVQKRLATVWGYVKAEQAEQEPVAERFEKMHANGDVWITTIAAAAIARNAAPVRTKDLTDDEERQVITATVEGVTTSELAMFKAVARAVIAADREKNK